MNTKEEILCKYVEYNDIEGVQRLLNEDANPTTISSSGRTAIGFACLNKNYKILELLLTACANYTPRSQSSSSESDDGQSESKKWKSIGNTFGCAKHDGDITPEGMEGLQWEDEMDQQRQQTQSKIKEEEFDDEWSVLYRYYASVIEKTGEMLANTISAREPHCLDAYQQAPLHYAVSVGSYECVESLLGHNAPVNMSTKTGYTALHLAVEQPRIVALLLHHKANPNKLTFYDQLAPIHLAAKAGVTETIQLLREAGANINITTLTEQTPLHLAITSQQFDASKKLIECGAKVNLEDEKGLTSLYIAIMLNNYELADLLLKNGARLLPSQYLLSYTIRNRMTAMTRLLIEAGENVNGHDYMGWTPVLLAISQRDIETIEYLLERGAKINCTDYVQKELHIAVQQSLSIDMFRRLLQLLVRHGVNVDSLNKWGETPLCQAMHMEKYKFAELLIKEGANVNEGCSIKVKECMLLVSECGSFNLIRLFVNAGMKMFWANLAINVRRQARHVRDSNEAEIECCKLYLARVAANPMSLKQLCRIEIRSRLMQKMKDFDYVKNIILSETKHSTESVFEQMVFRVGELPRVLHQYLYSFPDIATIR